MGNSFSRIQRSTVKSHQSDFIRFVDRVDCDYGGPFMYDMILPLIFTYYTLRR